MRQQKILDRFLRLHPKEIDLSLDRINKLLTKLDNPQNQLDNVITIVGTNGKYSTIQAMRSFYVESGLKCNLYLSPHIQKINERFIYDNNEISDNNLTQLLEEVENINNGDPITYFEILTAAFIKGCVKYKNNITLVEAGLFHNFDATNVFKKNLASVISIIHKDHLEWLPENDRTIDRIIFEKTSKLLNSNIIIAEQHTQQIIDKIEKSIEKNQSNKIFYKKDYNYSLSENNFFYYEDKYGGLKLPCVNLAQSEISNIAVAIATIRSLEQFKVNDEHIKSGITKIKNVARLQEIKDGKLKQIAKNNTILLDGAHNEIAALSLSKHIKKNYGHKKVFMCLAMMANKSHKSYVSYFKDVVESITTLNIIGQKNAISKEDLKRIIDQLQIKSSTSNSIADAINSISDKEKNALILITGSLYFCGEVLNMN